MAADVQLRHGYSLADIHDLAELAVRTSRRSHSTLRYPELIDLAFGGIITALYEAQAAPERTDLLRRGRSAIAGDVRARLHLRGISRDTWEASQHYWRYWFPFPTPSPEDRIVERLSLLQVWRTLPAHEQEALLALAVHENYQQAADALGVGYDTFNSRVQRGRRRFKRALLLPGETPHTWGHDRRVHHPGTSANPFRAKAAARRTAA